MNLNNKKISELLTPLIVIGLFFTVTNKVYLSAFPAALVLVILLPLISVSFYALLTKKQVNSQLPSAYLQLAWQNPISRSAYFFYAISFLSALIYFAPSFLQFGFYRYDGNFIISYALFLFLPCFYYQGNIEKLFERFIIFSALINIPLFIYYLQHDYIYFHPLFSATNAAGGFFSIVLSLAIALFIGKKQKLIFISIVLLATFLFFTTSRGSMLGLLAGIVAWYCTDKKKLKWLPIAMLLGVTLIQAALLMKYYPYYQQQVSYLDYQTTRAQTYADKKEENIYNRLINNWPKGWDAFSRSPVLGYGFGSINDQPYPSPDSMDGWFNLNKSQQKIFNDGHAHHSYLHVAAEQGIFGLLVLILFWYQIWRYLKEQKGSSSTAWIRNGLIIATWTIIFTSFTEHRITTPAMLLPFSLLFLIYFGYHQNRTVSKQ